MQLSNICSKGPHIDAPLFLDCCGLIRQAMRDLKDEFGFVQGPWNQAYQFDTLPNRVDSVDQLEPGDLVFYEGVYVKEGAKQQKHHMVHVEVFIGKDALDPEMAATGEATIGARWGRTLVQEWPSYQFEAKSWKLTKYYFCKIDTWLQGTCKSFCPEHAWVRRGGFSANSSVFANSSSDCEEDQEQNLKPSTRAMVCKGNNGALVAKLLTDRGYGCDMGVSAGDTDFSFKWTEVRSDIDWTRIRKHQIINHIQNINVISTKVGLLTVVREIESARARGETHLTSKGQIAPMSYATRYPSDKAALEASAAAHVSDCYIVKPNGGNCGRGIEVLPAEKTLGLLKAGQLSDVLVQEYIASPLLLAGRKFDIRCYALVVGNNCVFYTDGYVRRAMEPYNANTTFSQLTNAAIAKKHPNYATEKESVVWSMDQLEMHLSKNMPYTVPSDWVQDTLIPTMRNTVQDVLATVMPRLRLNGNNFELLGFDFLVDRQLNVRLLECNTNPALFVDSAAHQAVIPSLLAETLDIVIEAQVRTWRGIRKKLAPSN